MRIEPVVRQPLPQNEKERQKQIKGSAAPKFTSAFQDECTPANGSTTSTPSQFMADSLNTASEIQKPSPDYSTKRRRRAAIHKIIRQLEQIKDCEEQFCDRIPENLRSAAAFDSAEEFVSYLEEAIDALDLIDSI